MGGGSSKQARNNQDVPKADVGDELVARDVSVASPQA